MGYCSRRRGLIQQGWNDPANHDFLVAEVTAALPAAAAAGVPNLIVMSGNRRGQSVGQGIANCAAGLRQVAPLAERHGVTLCMEMLNSRVDHADYDADGSRYGLEVVERVGSPRFRLLYDIYHMQVMEGDVIHTIREHRAAFAHFHTAGVPGRHELDDRQELNYRAIATAIAEAGFTGYLAHEFIPTRPPYDGIREAMSACAA
jgi:hydroxypyruvate isomerase